MYGVPSGRGDTFFFGVIMRLWCTSWSPGHRGSLASCVFFVIYSLQLLALSSLSLHSTSPVSIIILLMLFHAFIGRNSGSWRPQHSFTGCQSFLNSGSSWSLHPRGPVSSVFSTGSGFVFPQLLFVGPKEILWLLLPAWKNPSVWLPLPNWLVDAMSLRDILGQHRSTYNYQGVSLCGSLTAYWAGFCGSPRWLPAVTTSS